nr:MAG TPA: hypothetical protein [Caudoviricetes sp.]
MDFIDGYQSKVPSNELRVTPAALSANVLSGRFHRGNF